MTKTENLTPEQQEVREEWLRQLRLDELHQGRGKLCQLFGNDGPRYCCLGVLRKVISEVYDTVPLEFNWGEDAHIPSRLQSLHGLSEKQQQQCVSWNDRAGFTFPEIADKIEAGDLDEEG